MRMNFKGRRSKNRMLDTIKSNMRAADVCVDVVV